MYGQAQPARVGKEPPLCFITQSPLMICGFDSRPVTKTARRADAREPCLASVRKSVRTFSDVL